LPIFINAFPLKIPNKNVDACFIPYENKKQLYDLRDKYQQTHIFRRQGQRIQIFSNNGHYPVSGRVESNRLKDNYGVFCFLVKDGVKRHLLSLDRRPKGFNPLELVSLKEEDNLLAKIIKTDYPFKINVKYKIDTRIIMGVPCLTIDCSTKTVLHENCQYFIKNGFNLSGRYIVVEQEDGYRKLLGRVTEVDGENLRVVLPDDSEKTIHSNDAYIEASRKNFNDYILHTHGSKQEALIEKIRIAISIFNGGESKNSRINKLKNYFQSKGIDLIDGTHIELSDAENIQSMCKQMDKPIFIFNDNGDATWTEKGLTQHGPYTSRTFDRNNPSICVICSQHDKGRIEQFVRKLLKGIYSSKYFKNGLEGKFSIGTSRVEVFVTKTEDVNGYKTAIETAIKKKSEDNGRWDLALVQVKEAFKALDVMDNPYYLGKSLFFLHQVPVQDFTIELLSQSDYNLGFSLNNMALACYAKMGGVPWLLKSSPTLSHELVVGIGSANIGQKRGFKNMRVMGITTVFSGDGNYIVSNTSKAVSPEEYCNALTSVLRETIEKVQKRMNWQKGDRKSVV